MPAIRSSQKRGVSEELREELNKTSGWKIEVG
jgi:hypothetical protein